jgi:Tol biopolymer transport system component
MLHRAALRISLLALTLAAGAAAGGAATLELVSRAAPSRISDTGTGAVSTIPIFVEPAQMPSISADGRYLVFLSKSSNLIPGQTDSNKAADVFLTDLTTGATTLVSHAMGSATTAGLAGSSEAVLSADGRYVAFLSNAPDLVPGQPMAFSPFFDQNVFLYDRITGTTSLAICNCREEHFDLEDLILSADGRYLLFVSDGNHVIPNMQGSSTNNVFLYDRVAKTARLVSHASGSATAALGEECENPSLSADGRYTVFRCGHIGLAPLQAFLFDRDSGTLSLLGPASAAVISGDGRYVALQSGKLVSLYERETG